MEQAFSSDFGRKVGVTTVPQDNRVIYYVTESQFSGNFNVNNIESVTLNSTSSNSNVSVTLRVGSRCCETSDRGMFECITRRTSTNSIDITNLFKQYYSATNPYFFVSFVYTLNLGVSTITGLSLSIKYKPSIIAGNEICCAQAYCGPSDPTPLGQKAGVTLSGGATPYTYKWQISTNSFDWSDIPGATSSTFDPPVLYTNTYYRRIVNPGASESKSDWTYIRIVPSNILVNNGYATQGARAISRITIQDNITTSVFPYEYKAGTDIVIIPPATINASGSGKVVLKIEACVPSFERKESEEAVEEYLPLSDQSEAALIHPNPISSGTLHFGRTVSNYSLLSSTGNLVQRGSNAEKLDVTGLSKGLYMLQLDGKIEKVIIE